MSDRARSSRASGFSGSASAHRSAQADVVSSPPAPSSHTAGVASESTHA